MGVNSLSANQGYSCFSFFIWHSNKKIWRGNELWICKIRMYHETNCTDHYPFEVVCGDSHTQLYICIWILLYVAFCTIMAILRQKEARSQDYALLLFRMTSRVLYSAQYHRQHCTLHAFEQYGALYMHNHDDKYPSRPGFEPGTPRLQAPVDTNEPSGPAAAHNYQWVQI